MPSSDEVVRVLTAEVLAEDAEVRVGYPVVLDLSGPRYRLEGSIAVALQPVRAEVLRDLRLDGNALSSLAGVERFVSLRRLWACGNSLGSVGAPDIGALDGAPESRASVRCARLVELHLCENSLVALPRLAGCAARRASMRAGIWQPRQRGLRCTVTTASRGKAPSCATSRTSFWHRI